MRYVLQHPLVQEIVNDLNVMTPEEIRKKYKYREAKLRYKLMFLLVLTTGKRGDVIMNLLIKKLQAAKKAANGLMVASVHNHKTFATYGAALLTFYTEEMYLACVGYCGAFR